MNIFDIIIILLIILSGVSGLKQGILKSFVNLVGTILVYFIAFNLKDKVGIFLCKIFPFFSFDGYPTLNILVYQLISFIFIASFLFGIFSLVIKLTGIIQKFVDLTIILTIPSKILGFIAGLIEGYMVMFIIVTLLFIPFRNIDIYKNSKLINSMVYHSPGLTNSLGGITDSLTDIFAIISNVDSNDENTKNQVNLDIMKVLLNCHVITKEDALALINMKKLDSVKNILEVVENYNSV